MSLFKGKYLRVLTPITSDGSSPKLNADGRIDVKETLLPVSAKRDLDLKNKYLPDLLKMKIDIVDDDAEQPAKEAKVATKK